MIQMVINNAEPLIFRDGRPFGDFGTVDGGVLRWPLPSTIAGMVRTKVGTNRATDFFWNKDIAKKKENIEAIKKVGLKWTLPVWKPAGGQWCFLFPRPADALFFEDTDQQDIYTLNSFSYTKTEQDCGHDLPWKNWLLPISTKREKPATDTPELWHQEIFLKWLLLEPMGPEFNKDQLGLALPELEVRMHTAIDSQSGTVKSGQLFSSSGIRLEISKNTQDDTSHSVEGVFGIGVGITGHLDSDNPFGPCLLGGERRTVFADPLETQFPLCPAAFDDQKFLRLVLITPGEFGGWAPDWLKPSAQEDQTPWVTVPETDIEVRLVSAHLSRWQAVSGWDYEKRGPKATSKLTPAGTVYLLELANPSRSQELAEHLWGRSINQELQDLNGYGVVCIGKANLS